MTVFLRSSHETLPSAAELGGLKLKLRLGVKHGVIGAGHIHIILSKNQKDSDALL